ncbi:hypothetical protein cyc_04786 [Cyclospora cayetanensis]|uniref:Transmembrane protein n=1 Tax=Cyclospora cayetanensis TaxID=88456 RepID=A0A1D3D5Q6_9EIME|nr:hypothetical protein cyc_04786 [Cyclospora cayetanensis]
MATMITPCYVLFVFAGLVSATVEQNSGILPNAQVLLSDGKVVCAGLSNNQAAAMTHLQSFQKNNDGFGGKRKLALPLAAALGIFLATLLLLCWSRSIRPASVVKPVPEDGLSEAGVFELAIVRRVKDKATGCYGDEVLRASDNTIAGYAVLASFVKAFVCVMGFGVWHLGFCGAYGYACFVEKCLGLGCFVGLCFGLSKALSSIEGRATLGLAGTAESRDR